MRSIDVREGRGSFRVGEESTCDARCESDWLQLGPYCGDGSTHASEDCDDGDDEEGNGCNTDCVDSGAELWTREAHVGATDVCRDVVRTPSGATYAIAAVPDLDGESWARAYWVRKYLADGTSVWTREYAPFGDVAPHDYIATAGAAVGEDVVVGGGHRTSQLGTVFEIPLVRFASGTGSTVWDRSDDDASLAADVLVVDGELVVAGRPTSGDDSAFYRISLNGQPIGSAVVDATIDPQRMALDGAGDVLVAGNDSDDATISQVRDDGLVLVSAIEYDDLLAPRGIGAAPAGGRVLGGKGGPGEPAWVRRTNAAGAEVWTVDEDSLAALGEVEDIAVTDTGAVIVVGERGGAPWIARLDPSGALQWARAPDEEGSFYSVVWDEAGDVTACGIIDGGGQADNIYVARYTE